MRKLFILLSLATSLCFFSCQSHQTRQTSCGTWAYAGGGCYALIYFLEDNTFETGGQLSAEGTYSIDGKDIKIYYSDGDESTMRISEDGYLYASNGSKYAKVSDKCE